MPRLLFVLLVAMSSGAEAIVIRDDVDDARYRVPPSELPALADLPVEGHGVLIAPRWVVTAAHAVTWQHEIKTVTINGTARSVERLVIHPGYKKPADEMIAEAVKTGDAAKIIEVLAASDDVALLELALPVDDVKPIDIYNGNGELGKVVKIIGKGATGTGIRGHDPDAPHRTELRRAFNTITRAEGRWLGYRFDKPPAALPLEGMSGNGDSGGPVLIEVEGRWQVAGLTSWKRGDANAIVLRPGIYGQTSYNVRLSHYVGWIRGVISAAPAPQPGVATASGN